MSPASSWDWVFTWTAIAIASGAALLLAWALLWDRSRGRRRCPRCWYNLSGTPTCTCPECGSTPASRAQHLRRMCRRKDVAFIVVLLALTWPV